MRAIWRQIVAVLSSNHHLTSISQKILEIQYPTHCKNLTLMTLIQRLREAVHSRSSMLRDDPPLAIGTVSFHLNADHPILRQIMVGEIPSFAIVRNYREECFLTYQI